MNPLYLGLGALFLALAWLDAEPEAPPTPPAREPAPEPKRPVLHAVPAEIEPEPEAAVNA